MYYINFRIYNFKLGYGPIYRVTEDKKRKDVDIFELLLYMGTSGMHDLDKINFICFSVCIYNTREGKNKEKIKTRQLTFLYFNNSKIASICNRR